MKEGRKRRYTTEQIHPRVDKAIANELKRIASMRNITESSIVDEALRTFLNQTEHEAVIAKSLNKLQRQYERMQRDQQILIETMATFVKVYLTHAQEISEEQKRMAEERGAERFERFLGIISRAFEGNRLFRDMVQERVVGESDFA